MTNDRILVFNGAKIVTSKGSGVYFSVSGEEKPKEILKATPENMKRYFGKSVVLSKNKNK